MNELLKITAIIISYSGLLLFIFSMIYYNLIKKQYNSVIRKYQEHGFFMKPIDSLAVHAGYFGSLLPTFFFWQLLTRKRIRLSRNEYLDNAPYDFIASLPKDETRWIKRYFYLYLLWFGLPCIGGVLMYLSDRLSW